MKETRKLFVGNDYASVDSLPGPMLSESGGGQVGSGGGTEEEGKEERARDGSIDESGWSASTMAGRAVNKPEEEEEEEEEVERTEEEEERTDDEEEKWDGEEELDEGRCGRPQRRSLRSIRR